MTQIEQAHPEDHGNKGKVFSASSVTGFGQLSPNSDYRGLFQSPAGRCKEMNNVIIYPVPALGQILCSMLYVHYCKSSLYPYKVSIFLLTQQMRKLRLRVVEYLAPKSRHYYMPWWCEDKSHFGIHLTLTPSHFIKFHLWNTHSKIRSIILRKYDTHIH